MRPALILSICILLLCSYKPRTPGVRAYNTANGRAFAVYEDQDLKLSRGGFLIQGRLADSYTVEEAIDLRAMDGKCQPRLYDVSDPNLIVKKETLISFYPEGFDVQGTVEKMVIGNDRNVVVRAWGFPQGITLPSGSEIEFYTLSYAPAGCRWTNSNNRLSEFFQTKMVSAVLGADFNVPVHGLLKKGTKLSFGSWVRAGTYANLQQDNGVITIEKSAPNVTSVANTEDLYTQGSTAIRSGNTADGVKLLKKAVDKNDLRASMMLGEIYLNGSGVPVDRNEGLTYYKITALLYQFAPTPENQELGVLAISRILEEGGQLSDGVEYYLAATAAKNKGDNATAANYMKKGADANFKLAIYEMGRMLIYGDGVATDGAAGGALISKAASFHQYVPAMEMMGVIYMIGLPGYPQSNEMSVHWYRKAADAGSEKAKKHLRELKVPGY